MFCCASERPHGDCCFQSIGVFASGWFNWVAAMGYYIRVLGKNLTTIPVQELREVALPAVVDLAESSADTWGQLILKHKSGQEIAVIERNPVVEGELGADELQEFLDELPHHKPDSAAAWLQEYLPTVTVIYGFQLLSGTDVDDGWTPLNRLHRAIWSHAGGILQADGEGFSNEEGFTVLWQFGESVTGQWNLGVMAQDGRWVHFEMDLGNDEHREAFWRGEVPAGVRLI
jgi:hypothetical protein